MTAIDYTIVHIEDDVSNWRENPGIVFGMIREILEQTGAPAPVIQEPADRYADTVKSFMEWGDASDRKRAQFIFTTDVGVESFKHELLGDLSFILDARRPGENNKLELTLLNSLNSVSPFVSDSKVQIRVFTAYRDVEDELKTLTKAKKANLKGISFPIEVISKTNPGELHAYMLGRLGFGQ